MRIEIDRDEMRLVVDALLVFALRVKDLGTRRSKVVATQAKQLADQMENGERTVRE
jgi:exopolyphosphatase/pppGpp-phosphohydrolase